MDFNEFQKICETKIDAARPADIAKEFNVTPQVVNNWKARNIIPYRYVKNLRRKIQQIDHDKTSSITNDRDIYNYGVNYNRGNEQFDIDIVKLASVLIQIFKKNFKIIIFITLLLGSVSAVRVLFFIAPTYTSSATLLPRSNKNSESRLGGLANQFGLNIPSFTNSSGNIESAELYPELIYSRVMARKILGRKFESSNFESKKMSLIKILINESADLKSPESFKMGSEILFSSIKVVSSKKTPVIRLFVSSTEPKLSAGIASAIIEELRLMQKKFRDIKAQKKKFFINERLKDVKAELIVVEEKLKIFREKNRKISSSPSLLLQKERLMREVGLKMEIYSTLKSQYEITQIEEFSNVDALDIIDFPYVPFFKSSPKRKVHVFVGVVVGLALSFFIILFKEKKQILEVIKA